MGDVNDDLEPLGATPHLMNERTFVQNMRVIDGRDQNRNFTLQFLDENGVPFMKVVVSSAWRRCFPMTPTAKQIEDERNGPAAPSL